jgi:lactam utilization protein B
LIAHGGAKIAVDARTICIHGDTPGAREIVSAVAQKLKQAGFQIRSLRTQGESAGSQSLPVPREDQ